MNAITFTIELLQPMLAAGLEGDPNAGVSRRYIAGSVLRGAIIGLYLRDKKKADRLYEINASDEETRNLFFDGKVCFLNAYPLVKVSSTESQRSLPVPLSWYIKKDEREEVGKGFYDFAKTEPPNKDEQYKALKSRFCVFKDTGSNIVKAEVKTRIAVHTQRNPIKGRATDEDGAVFRYESIETGMKFLGAVISEDVNLLNRIKPWLENAEISVGGSRTGGYGRANMTVDPTIDANWQETKRGTVADIASDVLFTVTLLSDALIRDENGQLQANNLFLKNTDIDSKKTFKKSEPVGGFNRKWGLPSPQQLAIKAGSVFTFKATQEIKKSEMEKWLNEGIGERKIDGFGRIAVNLNSHINLSFEKSEPEKVIETFLETDYGVRNGQIIVNRIFKHRLKSELIGLVGNFTVYGKPLKSSQISRLRLFIRKMLQSSGMTIEQAKTKFTDDFFRELKKTARDQFAGARVKDYENKDKGNLEKWICEEVLSNASFFSGEAVTLGKGAKKVTSRSDLLSLEFRLKLIDGVLERAAKESRS